MRLAALTMTILLTAASAQGQTVTVVESRHAGNESSFPVSFRTVGRISAPGPEHGIFHRWPGIYWEARISGPEVFISFDSSQSYAVYVDGKNIGRETVPLNSMLRISDLGPNAHTIRVEKVTESLSSAGRFWGFFVPDSNAALPAPPPRARQVEIVGDSYAAGYGTTSTKRECTQEEIRLTTDTQQAFGALLGKHYDADYQINAVSGIGMVRNYGGNDGQHPPLPDIYPYVLFDKSVAYDDPSWQPQVVVIALGDNDFATEVQPGEKWPDKAALTEDFIATYVTFVQSVRQKNPKATFVLVDFNEDALPGYLVEVAARLKAAGEDRVLLYHPGGDAFQQTGCDWHLSLNDHQRLAEGLEALIDSHPEIWPNNRQGH